MSSTTAIDDSISDYMNLVNKISSQGAVLFMVDISNPALTVRNPSMLEASIRTLGHSSMQAYYQPLKKYENIDALLPFYDDYPIPKTHVHKIYNFEKCGLSISEINGIHYLNDIHSKFYTVIHNCRITTDSPEQFDNTVHIFGHCHAVGILAEDRLTVSSQLQRLLNETPVGGRVFRVRNCANWQRVDACVKQMLQPRYRFEPGDVVVLINGLFKHWEAATRGNPNVRYFEFNPIFDRPHDAGEIFFDLTHTNHRGYALIAKALHKALAAHAPLPATGQTGAVSVREPGPARSPAPDIAGLRGYLNFLERVRVPDARDAGAIVMNCNPFTLGHLYLVERALEQTGMLYVFIVEEDRSAFSFRDRFSMARAALAGKERVRVLPSGTCIISSSTLPEYFTKDDIRDVAIDASLDIALFAEHIAPALDITKRFFGHEPFCAVTGQYNREMEEHLPRHGVAFVEIPRLTADGVGISASEVRRLANAAPPDWERLARLVPESTLRHLRESAVRRLKE